MREVLLVMFVGERETNNECIWRRKVPSLTSDCISWIYRIAEQIAVSFFLLYSVYNWFYGIFSVKFASGIFLVILQEFTNYEKLIACMRIFSHLKNFASKRYVGFTSNVVLIWVINTRLEY